MTVDTIIKNARTAAVFTIGMGGMFILSILLILLVRIHAHRGEDIINTAAALFGCALLGVLIVSLFCLLAYHGLSYGRSTHLAQAIRISEAMQMLHAHTHHERLKTIKQHSVRIFKAKNELPQGITEDIQCKEISTFLSPMFFNIDRLNAIGSPYYCCDNDQIQAIIAVNRVNWCSSEGQSGTAFKDIIAAKDRTIADLHEKNKESTSKYTAAAGREGRLKKQQADVSYHMATLVELANWVTINIKPPRTITRDEIKAKYLAIGKLHGVTEAPGEYVELFRKAMPKDVINWSGAPKQGDDEEET